MSGAGRPDGPVVDGRGLRVAVAAARWHPEVVDPMVDSALRVLADCRVPEVTQLRVPGAFELPVVAAALARDHDAVVCLAAVVRGGTPHFDHVCRAVTDGCARVALDSGVPVGFGVLTCDDLPQALDRCGRPGATEDKGREAALAAVATAVALRAVRGQLTAGRG